MLPVWKKFERCQKHVRTLDSLTIFARGARRLKGVSIFQQVMAQQKFTFKFFGAGIVVNLKSRRENAFAKPILQSVQTLRPPPSGTDRIGLRRLVLIRNDGGPLLLPRRLIADALARQAAKWNITRRLGSSDCFVGVL